MRALEGSLSAQNTDQGSETDKTELIERAKENNILLRLGKLIGNGAVETSGQTNKIQLIGSRAIGGRCVTFISGHIPTTAVTASFSSRCQTIHKTEVSQKLRTLSKLLGVHVLANSIRFACPRSEHPWRQASPPDKRSPLRKIYSSTGAGLTGSVYASRRNPWRD